MYGFVWGLLHQLIQITSRMNLIMINGVLRKLDAAVDKSQITLILSPKKRKAHLIVVIVVSHMLNSAVFCREQTRNYYK